MYGVPYSSEGLAHVYLVDPETGNRRKFRIPGNENGAYCDVAGTDGKLYLGTMKGKLLSFDPADGEFEELCTPFEYHYPWGGLATRTGKVVLGVYPSGSFAVWDIASKKIEYAETRKLSGANYANCFSELPDGRILAAIGGAEPHIAIYDPQLKAVVWRDPEWLKDSTFLYAYGSCNGELLFRSFPEKELLFVRPQDLSVSRRLKDSDYHVATLRGKSGIDEVWGIDSTTGRLHVFKGGSFEYVATPIPYEAGHLCALDAHTLAMITVEATYVRYDTRTGRTFSKALDSAESGGMVCSALASDGKNTLYISPYINQRLIRMDLREGSSREIARTTEHGGQVPVMRWHRNKLYMAYYIFAGMCVYDPEKPYRFRENPKVLGLAGEEQYRPMGRMESDGRRLYFSTRAMYGKLGGGIVALDPETQSWRTFRNVIPDQNLTGVVFEPCTGLLFAAGEIEGDCGSCLPKARLSEWIAWDPRTERRVGGGAIAGCKIAQVLESMGDGRVLLQDVGAKALHLIEAATMAMIESEVPLPNEDCRPIHVLVRASDGNMYGLGGGSFFRWKPGTGVTEKLFKCGGRCLIEASPGRLVFNDKARIGEYRFD